MAQLTEKPAAADAETLRAEWVGRVTALVDQIAGWAAAEGWQVERQTATITERRLGTYDAPAVTVHPLGGEVSVTPVALDMLGRTDGRIDVRAIPTMSRVKLVGGAWGDWEIIAGSNIPLRRPWNRQTFVQLVADLLS